MLHRSRKHSSGDQREPALERNSKGWARGTDRQGDMDDMSIVRSFHSFVQISEMQSTRHTETHRSSMYKIHECLRKIKLHHGAE